MNERETKVFNETRIRNLRRKQAKIANVPHLADEYLAIEEEIKKLSK